MRWLLLVAPLTSTGSILAATGDTGLSPSVAGILTILQVPVFGALTWAFLTGRIRTRDELDRVIKERDLEREERVIANTALTEKALPAVTQLQETMKQATEVIVRLEDRLAYYELDSQRSPPRKRTATPRR